MENSEVQKTKFWQSKVLSHMREMRAAKLAGLFPKSEGWRNVVEHELVEFEAFDVLAETLKMSDEDRRKGSTAALLHDVYKRKEREAFTKKGVEGAKEADEEQANFLKNLGYEGDIAELTELVGGYSLPHFLEDSTAESLILKKDLPILELALHYIDDITLGSDLVLLKDRIAYVKERYKEEDEAGRAIYSGRLFSEVQFEVSRQIEEKLASMLSVEPSESLPDFIKGKILQRINKE